MMMGPGAENATKRSRLSGIKMSYGRMARNYNCSDGAADACGACGLGRNL